MSLIVDANHNINHAVFFSPQEVLSEEELIARYGTAETADFL
jgi:hypothetical protein